jgi:hypothetical protein
MTKLLVVKTTVRPSELKGQVELVSMSSRKVELLTSKGLMGARVSSAKNSCCTYSLPTSIE